MFSNVVNISLLYFLPLYSTTKLRFDNGYGLWNTYTYVALLLTVIAVILDLLILKKLAIRAICYKKDKVSLSVNDVKSWRSFHYLVVENY